MIALILSIFAVAVSGFQAPMGAARSVSRIHMAAEPQGVRPTVGQGYFDGPPNAGGEATRDPEPTEIDPNDPKGKQKAIHKSESFAEYLKKRQASGGGSIGSDK